MLSTIKSGIIKKPHDQPKKEIGIEYIAANKNPLLSAFMQSFVLFCPSLLDEMVCTEVLIPKTKLKAPHISIPPIPVAARASGPNRPTIATSTRLIKTRLRLLIMTGKAKNHTALKIL